MFVELQYYNWGIKFNNICFALNLQRLIAVFSTTTITVNTSFKKGVIDTSHNNTKGLYLDYSCC